jgi:uncharacterized LabA/DUF88 family protein
MRTYVYIDGFNLYYGAVRGTPYKWLDLMALMQGLLKPHHVFEKIKYFTAMVDGRADPAAPLRQRIYLDALRTYIPKLEVHLGHFLSNRKTAREFYPPHKPVDILHTEEKGSDVNLAVHLVHDSWQNLYDCAVVVSNYSDLAEAMRIVHGEHRRVVGLITPDGAKASAPRRTSRQLAQHATFIAHIRRSALAANQLPNPIPGTALHKPSSW